MHLVTSSVAPIPISPHMICLCKNKNKISQNYHQIFLFNKLYETAYIRISSLQAKVIAVDDVLRVVYEDHVSYKDDLPGFG